MYKLRKNKHWIISILLFIFLLTPLLQITVEAHNAVFLSSTIDTVNKKYIVDVMEDRVGFLKEESHLEAKLGNFAHEDANLITDLDNPLSPWTSNNLGSHEEQKEREHTDGSKIGDESPWSAEEVTDYKIFTFPTTEESSRGVFGSKNHATSEDTDRAFNVGSQLSASLNGLLSFVNGGRSYKSVDQLILTSLLIRPGSDMKATVPGKNGVKYHITYHKPSEKAWVNEDGSVKGFVERVEPGGSIGNPDNETMTFVYAIPKGYVPVNGNNKPIVGANSETYEFAKKAAEEAGKHDTPWITIHHLTAQANHANTVGVTYQTGRPEEAENVITQTIKTFLVNILYGLLNWFGLYNVDDLIFNRGIKASSIYSNGLMTTEWWNVVVRYHIMAQYLAVVILIGAIIKTLIQVNYSTINPAVRMYLYKIFERLAAVAILLVGIIPLTLVMVGLNNAIVDIFATQVDVSNSARAVTHGGLISGLIIEFFFFAITFYINFVYIMRNFVIALLIASAPLFVVSMAFSYQTRGLFDIFIKELIANIFLQAFHAFSFAFIFNLQANSRGIESIVAIGMLIPLTEFFRELVFGRSGGGAISMGKTAGQAMHGVAMGAKNAIAQQASGAVTSKVAGETAELGGQDKDLEGNQGYSAAGSHHKPVGNAMGKKGGPVNAASALGAKKLADGFAERTGSKDGKGGLGNMAAGIGLSAASGLGTMAEGMDGIAGGIVFDNPRSVIAGAETMGKGIGVSAAGVASSAGAVGSQLGSEFKESRNNAKLKAGDREQIHKINPLTSVADQNNGTSNLKYDGAKLQAKGISGIGTRNGGKGMSMTFDAAQGGFTKTMDKNGNTVIKATEEGQNMANIISLSGSSRGRNILKEEMGIDNVSDLGGGKYKLDFNEKFMQQNGINGVQKSQQGNNVILNKNNEHIASNGSSHNFIPKSSREQVTRGLDRNENPAQLTPEKIIQNEGGNDSSQLFQRDNNQQKWNNFKIKDFSHKNK